MDTAWIEHITTMTQLREGIQLRGYAQVNPLQAYAMEGYELFQDLLEEIDQNVSIFLLRTEIRQNSIAERPRQRMQMNDGKPKVGVTVKKNKKPKRNDPCPCGSGKKYKQCCGK